MKKKFTITLVLFAAILMVAQAQNFNLPTGYDRTNQELEVPHAPATQVILPQNSSPMRSSSFSEGFDDINLLPGLGWALINNSSPLGLTNWFQGNFTVFSSHAGAAGSYIGANFNNTSGVGTISNWLITPQIVMNDGDVITFWTRTATGTSWPDRLELRLSPNGNSTDVGALATDVGDFTTLLLSVNPTLIQNIYPEDWTEFTATLAGVGANVSGRLALRYFVTNGGPNGANSNYIGVDTFSYESASTPPVPISNWALYLGVLMIVVFSVIRLRKLI